MQLKRHNCEMDCENTRIILDPSANIIDQKFILSIFDESVFPMQNSNFDYTVTINQKRSKNLLRKCRRCNMKRRLCQVSHLHCPALKRECFFCKKGGHFKGSLNCKKGRKSNRKMSNYEAYSPKSNKHTLHQVLTDKDLALINRRIYEIESSSKLLHKVDENNESVRNKKFISMIPYLLMFLFLNFDCLVSSKVRRLRSSLQNVQNKMRYLTKVVGKLLRRCVQRNQDNQEKRLVILRNFSDRVKKTLFSSNLSKQDICFSINLAFSKEVLSKRGMNVHEPIMNSILNELQYSKEQSETQNLQKSMMDIGLTSQIHQVTFKSDIIARCIYMHTV